MDPSRAVIRRTLVAGAALAAVLAGPPAGAQEANRGEAPTPDSVEGLSGALEGSFEEEEEKVTIFPWLHRQLQHLPPFFADTDVSFEARTFYWLTDQSDGTRHEAWALGGALEYRSGWIWDAARIGAAVYTSQKLYGPKAFDGTGLLQEGQKGYTIAGKAFAEFQWNGWNGDNRLKVFRQELDFPYVNRAFTRMTPNTFEAYRIQGAIPDIPVIRELRYIGSFTRKIRARDEEDFVYMSEAAGASGSKEPMATLSISFAPADNWSFGGINHLVPETLNVLYGEVGWTHAFNDDLALRLEGQFTHQHTIGKEILPEDPFTTWNGTARIAVSYKGAIFTLAGAVTAREHAIISPWGLYPGYIALMQSDFNRAGEDAFLLGISYDFARVGVPGLSGFFNYASGFDSRVRSGSSEGDFNEEEFNLTADYRIQDGPLRGLWFRGRFSRIVSDLRGFDSNQVRLIVNYDIPIL